MGGCVSLNYCNRGGGSQSNSSGRSGRRRRNRRDLVECNSGGGNGGGENADTVVLQSSGNVQLQRSSSFSNMPSTNGDNMIEPTSNSYQSTNSMSTSNQPAHYVPPTGKNKRMKHDYMKLLKRSHEGRTWLATARKMTESEVAAKRDEFWHTAPAFDGKPEIWEALKASVDALEAQNYQLAQAIVDSANIILPNGVINDCYDELGNRYQLPMYVLIKPMNLRRKGSGELNSNDLESESDTSKVEKKKDKKKKKNTNNRENEDTNLDTEDKKSKALKKSNKSNKSDNVSGDKSKPLEAEEQPPQNVQIKLRISSFDQDSSKGDVKMTVNLSDSVLSVKKRINELYKIETADQRLYFSGRLMKDKERLKVHHLKKNVVIQVVVREKENLENVINT